MSDSDGEDMPDDINASSSTSTTAAAAADADANADARASTGPSGRAASSAADGGGAAVETVGFGGSLVAQKEPEADGRWDPVFCMYFSPQIIDIISDFPP